MNWGRIIVGTAFNLLLIGMASMFGDLRAQCQDNVAPLVRLVSCGGTTIKIIFEEKQPFAYDSHWISWGDGNIQQLFPRQKGVSHLYLTSDARKITVWGTINPGVCKGSEVVLNYTPGAGSISRSNISEFRMLTRDSGEISVDNPSNIELLLYGKSGSGDWESTGRTVSKDNQQLEVFVDSLAATCFRLESTDTCLVSSSRSDPICSGRLSVESNENGFIVSFESKLLRLMPPSKPEILKDGLLWLPNGDNSAISASILDQELSCIRDQCYQLIISNSRGRFTSLPTCRRPPTVLCGTKVPLFVPDAFSPNGDGINDVFEIKGEVATDFEVTVFSAWGTAIYHSRSITRSWDGKLDGTSLPPGLYVYKIKLGTTNSSFVKTGSVLLLE